jgi:pimeloyl-ACP methyl ester carboxylesterase
MSIPFPQSAEPALVHVVAGHRLSIHRHGPVAAAGPALQVFLVHGMGDSGDTWLRLREDLPNATLWTFDMPWSGRESNDWPYCMSATDWWRAALALCPVAPDICVGHSFGTTVLMDWLHGSEPAPALRGLVLVSPFYHSGRRAVEWSELNEYACRLPERLAVALRARMETRMEPTPTVMAAMVQMLSRRIVPDAILEFFRLFLKSRRWPLRGLACPVLVVVGDQDEALVQDSATELARSLPLAQLYGIADCGHYPMHQQPAVLARQFAVFLESVGMDHPRSAFGAPPQGGAASGPAEPDPRQPLDASVHAFGVPHGALESLT